MTIVNTELKRRISLEKDFMDWHTDDLLFGLMYYHATYQPEEERLYLTKANYTRRKKEFYQLPGTENAKNLRRHLQKLMEKGLVAEDEVLCNGKMVEAYTFPYDKDLNYQLVDRDMLFYVISTRSKFAIQIYVYLLNKFIWKKQTDEFYSFDNSELQQLLGYSKTSHFDTPWVTNILESFKREGVINYVDYYETIVTDNGKEIRMPQRRLLFVAQKTSDLREV